MTSVLKLVIDIIVNLQLSEGIFKQKIKKFLHVKMFPIYEDGNSKLNGSNLEQLLPCTQRNLF